MGCSEHGNELSGSKICGVIFIGLSNKLVASHEGFSQDVSPRFSWSVYGCR
jgi:hypothetical protein